MKAQEQTSTPGNPYWACGAIPCATPLLGSETKSHKATSKWLLMPPPPHCHPQLGPCQQLMNHPKEQPAGPYSTSKQEKLIPAPHVPVPSSLFCSLWLFFLPPCSRFPNFAAKMQRRRKPSLLQHCRAPTDLPWGRSRRAIPQGSPQTR